MTLSKSFVALFVLVLIRFLNGLDITDQWTWIETFKIPSNEQDSLRYVEELITLHNINILSKDENGTTFLHIAATHGHFALIQYFISQIKSIKMADYINAQDKYLDSSFHKACFNGYEDIVRVLLTNGANMTLPTQGGATCLHIAAYNGHISIINLLVKEYHVSINTQTSIGSTALHYAVGRGLLEAVKELLALGAQVDQATNSYTTPLHVACLKENVDMIKLLIQHGKADIHIRNDKGNTALDIYELAALKSNSDGDSSSSSSNSRRRSVAKFKADMVKLYHDVHSAEEQAEEEEEERDL